MSILNQCRSLFIRTHAENPDPITKQPLATRAEYLKLHEKAKSIRYPSVEEFEHRLGYSVDRKWLDDLALHTQIVIKKSELLYQHGGLLYAILRDYLARLPRTPTSLSTVLETGTARGFSSLCMARALLDGKAAGIVLTVDQLPHNRAIYWNCIDDLDGKKTRQELLARWSDELSRVVFVQGSMPEQLDRLGIDRIGFAFLDAQHTKEDVMAEYEYVSTRQSLGDVIFFDDVTPGLFSGVVEAVDLIESQGLYLIDRIQLNDERGYAIARRREGV